VGGFDAWPINTEFLGDDRAIFRVGVFRSMTFHCKILNMPSYFGSDWWISGLTPKDSDLQKSIR
jgi:hypothetical protein